MILKLRIVTFFRKISYFEVRLIYLADFNGVTPIKWVLYFAQKTLQNRTGNFFFHFLSIFYKNFFPIYFYEISNEGFYRAFFALSLCIVHIKICLRISIEKHGEKCTHIYEKTYIHNIAKPNLNPVLGNNNKKST